MSDVVYALSTGFIESGIMTREGEIWDAADPMVAAHPSQFTPDPSRFARTSRPQPFMGMPQPGSTQPEAATAAPGEKRSIGLPKPATRGR
jgi:hypothetical protein